MTLASDDDGSSPIPVVVLALLLVGGLVTFLAVAKNVMQRRQQEYNTCTININLTSNNNAVAANLIGGELPFPRASKLVLRLLMAMGFPPEDVIFGKFSDFRTRFFAKHLQEATVRNELCATQCSTNCSHDTLRPTAPALRAGLKTILAPFHEPSNHRTSTKPETTTIRSMGNSSQVMATNNGDQTISFQKVVFCNDDALQARLDMIEKAKSKIQILTWSLDGATAEVIARALIDKKNNHGNTIEIQIIVDRFNLHFLAEKSNLTKSCSPCFQTFRRLLQHGIHVKLIRTRWFENADCGDVPPELGKLRVKTKKPACGSCFSCTGTMRHAEEDLIIGSHRKLMLVDDELLLTGGRNLSDEYLKNDVPFRFEDVDVILRGRFKTTTSRLFQELWDQATDLSTDMLLEDPGMPAHCKFTIPKDSVTTSSTHTDCRSDTESLLSTFGSSDELSIPLAPDTNVSMLELDHSAGRVDGEDIVLASLIFLVDQARESVDLVFGYFQLFRPLEAAIERALARGVRVRLFTNSEKTCDIWFIYSTVFVHAMSRLLERGVEVYVPSSSANNNSSRQANDTKQQSSSCLHHKFALVDDHAVLLGSWNCLGVSVFYDAEYSVVLFSEFPPATEEAVVTAPFRRYLNDLLSKGCMERLEEAPCTSSLGFLVLFLSPESLRISARGY